MKKTARVVFGIVGTVLVGALGFARAETLTWNGGTSGSLGTAANWTPARTPQDGDVLKFPKTLGAVTVQNDLTVTLGGLDLQTTGMVKFEGTLPLRLNGLVTSSAEIAGNAKSYPSDRIDCPVELVGNTHFRLTGVPAGVGNPSISACRNLDIYGYVAGSGDLVVSNESQRGVSLRLHCTTNAYTGVTVVRSMSGGNYAGFTAYGNITNGPSCVGVNREIHVAGRFSFGEKGMVVDRDFVLPFGGVTFWVDQADGVLTETSTIRGTNRQNLEFRNASLWIDGHLSNVTVSRNDKGTIRFTNPTNDIRNTDLAVLEGTFVARKLAPMGQPSSFGSSYTKIILGKESAQTYGCLAYDGATDATIDAPIHLKSQGFTGDFGAYIDNWTKGTTLTVAGDVCVYAPKKDQYPHQRLHLRGVGDGVLAGNIDAGVHFVKKGVGTWTVSGETIATTGMVEVLEGRLNVDTTIAAASRVSVAANATLGGTGTISVPVTMGENVTLVGGLTLSGAVTLGEGTKFKASSSPVVFSGSVTFPSRVLIDVTDVPVGGALTVFTVADATSVTGLDGMVFQLSDGEAVAAIEQGAVVIRRKGTFTWTGAQDAQWNTTSANWRSSASESAVAFVANENALFTEDATPADRREIAVAEGTVAANVTVGGTNAYTFTGGSLLVNGVFTKAGSGTLVVENALTANQGFLVSEGVLDVKASASLGSTPVMIESKGVHSFRPGTPLTGSLTIGKRDVISTIVDATATALAAENGAPVTLVPSGSEVGKETILRVRTSGVVTNRDLCLTTGGGRVKIQYYPEGNGDFVWSGDVVCANNPMVYFHGQTPGWTGGGDFVIGELGRTVLTGKCALISFREGNVQHPIVVNSHIDVESGSFELNVGGVVKFMAPSNRWTSSMGVNSGTILLGTNDTLDVRHGLSLGTSDKGAEGAPSYSILDLNGFDQTVTWFGDSGVANTVSGKPWSTEYPNYYARQIIRSATPATFTLASDVNESKFFYPYTQITGAVSVVKKGKAALKLHQPNHNTGNWTLLGGTTTVADSSVQGAEYGGTDLHGTFGAASNIVVGAEATLAFTTARTAFAKGARLTVEEGGTVQMDADQVVDYLTLFGQPKKAGTYTAAKNPEFVTGTGTLTVRVGEGGTLLLFR